MVFGMKTALIALTAGFVLVGLSGVWLWLAGLSFAHASAIMFQGFGCATICGWILWRDRDLFRRL
jgi:uncharacterized membrane protein YuzA (DUF378 family)